MWLFGAHLSISIFLQSQESVDGPSLLGEATDDYEKNESSESLGSGDDLLDVGSSPLAGEESWHGICASSAEETAQLCASGSRTHKPPTGAEITAIKEAQDLFMSSSFKFQVTFFVRYRVSYCLTFRAHRLMLFCQTFGRKIHANNRSTNSSFLFMQLCRLFRPSNLSILW